MPVEIRIQVDDSGNIGVAIPKDVPKAMLYMMLEVTRDAVYEQSKRESERLIQPATLGMPRIQ